jgi:hypothetical protein
MTEPADPARPADPFASSGGGSSSAGAPTTGSPFGGQPAPLAGDAIAPVTVRRRSTASMLVNVLLGVALVVAVGGVAFAAGRATAPAAATGRNGFGNGQFGGNGQAFGPGASGAPDRGGFGAFGAGGLSIQGTVTAVAAESITLQLASGQTLTIPLDTSTTYHSRTAANASDVTNGATVIVQLAGGGRGFGNGNGNGNGNGQPGQGPTGSGAPGRALGSASSVTIVPAGS